MAEPTPTPADEWADLAHDAEMTFESASAHCTGRGRDSRDEMDRCVVQVAAMVRTLVRLQRVGQDAPGPPADGGGTPRPERSLPGVGEAALLDAIARQQAAGPRPPDVAPCGVCGEPIVSAWSEAGEWTWCHEEVPVGSGHVAEYVPAAPTDGGEDQALDEGLAVLTRVVDEDGEYGTSTGDVREIAAPLRAHDARVAAAELRRRLTAQWTERCDRIGEARAAQATAVTELAQVQRELANAQRDLDERDSLRTLAPEQCCELGCSGACETCPCCCAGWCVFGHGVMPEWSAEELSEWAAVAIEHNPLVKHWVAVTVERDEARAALAARAAQAAGGDVEPDGEYDGVYRWITDPAVSLDPTSSLHPPTIRVGGEDWSWSRVRHLRDVLSTALCRAGGSPGHAPGGADHDPARMVAPQHDDGSTTVTWWALRGADGAIELAGTTGVAEAMARSWPRRPDQALVRWSVTTGPDVVVVPADTGAGSTDGAPG